MPSTTITNKSVRDHKQVAELLPLEAKVRVTMYVGSRKVDDYEFAIQDFRASERECPGNPRYARRQFIQNCAAAHLTGDGGAAQAERIVDAQLAACEELLGIQ